MAPDFTWQIGILTIVDLKQILAHQSLKVTVTITIGPKIDNFSAKFFPLLKNSF
jgi:hypothetical protein